MKQDSKNYKVRCVGYKGTERFFTIDQIYDVVDGEVTSDDGYTYRNWDNIIEFLSRWYKFEKVTDDSIISRVIFNDPATIILWADGTEAVAKASKGDAFDPEKGFAVACAKKLWGNGEAFRTELAKWIPVDKTKMRIVKEENRRLTEDELCNMQGQKVWCESLDAGCYPDEMVEYSGWYKVKGDRLVNKDGLYYEISAMGNEYGFHAYREPPKK